MVNGEGNIYKEHCLMYKVVLLGFGCRMTISNSIQCEGVSLVEIVDELPLTIALKL